MYIMWARYISNPYLKEPIYENKSNICVDP